MDPEYLSGGGSGWGGGDVMGRGLEIVTVPSSYSGAESKQGGPSVAVTRQVNLRTDLWLPRL